jgi:hypothetical protein
MRGVTSGSSPRRRRAGTALATLGLFTVLAVAHTWPLAAAPRTLSRNDNADTVLHEWILAWVTHQAVHDPTHLFDANIFYPERHTLAYSDPLFVEACMAAPLLWAGASPVLAYNLVLIAGFALTGWAMSFLVSKWTGSLLAGMLSGTLVAFNAFTLTRLPQIQDQHLEFFPLVLLTLDRLLAWPRAREAMKLAGYVVLQALTGTYFLVFTAISIVAATAARPREWVGVRGRAFLTWAALAALMAIVLLAPLLWPYYLASREQGLNRSLDETALYSAHVTDYLATGGRLHFAWWSHRFFRNDALFPGLTALGLAGVAVASGVAVRDRRARMVVAFGVVAFALSFGPAFPPYRWLYHVFPLMSGIRGAARFGQIALVSIGILAGFGLVAIQRRMPQRRAVVLSVFLLLAANVEAWRAPIGYFPYRGIPPVYDALDTIGPDAVLVWVPFHSPTQVWLDAPFMLISTRSWHPMLNGYSGFTPASYERHAAALNDFPDEASVRYLQDAGVTHVLVDGRNMRRRQLDRLPQFQALSLLVTDGNLRIYQLAR